MAEDWAPIGIPLPEILAQGPPVKLEDDNLNPIQRDYVILFLFNFFELLKKKKKI